MSDYYCPHCGADLGDQYGFDPDAGYWTCTECGQFLMDDDIADGDEYEGVAWFCDNCNALLNRQSGFSDSYSTWTCTECGHTNGLSEEDILEDQHKCPACGANLKKQWSYSEYMNDYTCSECSALLHRDYSSDEFTEVDDDEKCPNCGAYLKNQWGFSDYEENWTWVLTRLGRVSDVANMAPVTEENDPNGNLNKAGGYTSTVYFGTALLGTQNLTGNPLIDEGTDAGGAIETYRTVEEAEKRNSYLASFDGAGMFSSGSHMVLGTMVVRTSDDLKASQQETLTNAIVAAMTSLD